MPVSIHTQAFNWIWSLTVSNKVDPVIATDSGVVYKLDSSKNYESLEIAAGVDKSALYVSNVKDDFLLIVFNNEI